MMLLLHYLPQVLQSYRVVTKRSSTCGYNILCQLGVKILARIFQQSEKTVKDPK